MLTQLKNRIEAKVGKPIDNGTLLKAISMAKSDVVSNKLIMGQDVTAQEFDEILIRCLGTIRECQPSWGKEEYETAIKNHEAVLKENPEDQELLQKLQRLNLEYARYQKEVE